MTHLRDTELVDLLDGTLHATRAAHVDACVACRSRADALRETVARIEAVPAQQPSPLFWEHFSAKVNERIDAAPDEGRWFVLPRLAFVALGTLAVILVGFNLLTAPNVGAPSRSPAPVAAVADAPIPATGLDDLEADVDWAVVRAAADDLDVEDAKAAGLATRPGTVDRMAMELSDAERAELIRLVESEMKSGA